MSQVNAQAKQGRGLLTLRYLGAGLAAIAAVVSSIALLSLLVQKWAGGGLLSLLGGYESMVSLAVTAAVSAVLAMLLYRSVTKEIVSRTSYVSSTPYIIITNAVFGFFALLFISHVVSLVSTLISSLLLIGSGADIGAMYLHGFLPTFVAAGLSFVAAFMTYKIAKGQNKSGVLGIILVAVAGALLLATLITVPIAAHSSSSPKKIDTRTYDYDYFDSLFDE